MEEGVRAEETVVCCVVGTDRAAAPARAAEAHKGRSTPGVSRAAKQITIKTY